MLGKLLKYEFKATARTLLPLYAVLLAWSLLTHLTVMRDNMKMLIPDSFSGILQAIILMAYGCILGTVCIVTVLLLIQRFYKNLLRDEGYLMHTLPVATWQNIAAKLIPAVLWSTFSIVAVMLSAMILGLDFTDWHTMFSVIGVSIRLFTEEIGLHWMFYALEVLLLIIVALAGSILEVYLALAAGHMADNRRILWSVAAYIGISLLLSLFTMLLMYIFGGDMFDFLNGLLQNTYTPIRGAHMVLCGLVLVNLVKDAIFFLGTNYLMKRHLNLE